MDKLLNFLTAKVENKMDKESREALQVAKELTAKFIETRTVSPANFAQVFPAIFQVVRDTITINTTSYRDES